MTENLEFLFEFIDGLPVGIARNDTTGQTPNHFNQYIYSMFGWEESDIDTMEKWFSNAYPDETYRAEVIRMWQAMIDDTEANNKTFSYPIEVKVACKGGGFRWCKARYYRKKNFIYGIFTDISTQKENEERLNRTLEATRALELRKNLALKAGTIGIWEWDFATDTLLWDETLYRIYGIDPATDDGSPYTMWSNTIDPADKPQAEAYLFKARETNTEYNMNFWITTPAGERKFIQAVGTNEFDSSGKAVRMVGINKDITASKDIELQLKERVQQEIDKNKKNFELMVQQSKQATLGEVLNNIAHHWRQPLTVIDLQLQELEYDYQSGELNDTLVQEIIDTSRNEIRFLSNTIDRFRKFFLPYKTAENIDMKKSFESTLELLELDFKRLSILVTLDEKKPLTLFGLQGDINQVLIALLNNAKDAIARSKAKGEIHIVIDQNSFSVSDNGGGIPAEDLDKVFNPYFSTKFSGKGVGLSLFMVKGIVENKLNGTIGVKNHSDGAVFTVTFANTHP